MSVYAAAAVTVFVYFFIFFIVAQILKNNSIVDMGWGPGFMLIAWVTYILSPSFEGLVIPILVTVWALRLMLHIGVRNLKKGEDYRYVAMRKSWGDHVYVNAFFKVFMLQGVFQYLVALSIMGRTANLENQVLLVVGLILFSIGFYFEAVGDAQLKRFIKNRTDREAVMTTGLWRYTRHPNYFGDALVWWGIGVIGFGYGGPIWGLIGALAMTILLRYVSGVPFLERRYANHPAYQVYKQSTSIFIPWFKFKHKA